MDLLGPARNAHSDANVTVCAVNADHEKISILSTNCSLSKMAEKAVQMTKAEDKSKKSTAHDADRDIAPTPILSEKGENITVVSDTQKTFGYTCYHDAVTSCGGLIHEFYQRERCIKSQ